MKKLTVLLSSFLLNGCFIYSAEDDCIYGLVRNQCFGKEYSTIARYQKPYSLGKTDTAQRWLDVEGCGGTNINGFLNTFSIKNNRDKKGRIIPSVIDDFMECMKQKGYIIIDECGRKNSTTDKGICNENENDSVWR